MFDGLRQRFADGDISIPNDPELISQLASLTYRYNARGQLQLESKDQIRSTGRQSPDKADAIALAFTSEIKTRPRAKTHPFLHASHSQRGSNDSTNAATPDGETKHPHRLFRPAKGARRSARRGGFQSRPSRFRQHNPGTKGERGIIGHLRNLRNLRFRRHRPFRKAKGAQATDTSPNDRKQSAGDAPGGGAGCGIPSPLMGEG